MPPKTISPETRTAILAAAWELISTRGRTDVGQAEIAAAAKVSRQTVFYAFGNRAGLLHRQCQRAARCRRDAGIVRRRIEGDIDFVGAAGRAGAGASDGDDLAATPGLSRRRPTAAARRAAATGLPRRVATAAAATAVAAAAGRRREACRQGGAEGPQGGAVQATIRHARGRSAREIELGAAKGTRRLVGSHVASALGTGDEVLHSEVPFASSTIRSKRP